MTDKNWQTTTTLKVLKTRAKLISLIHEFFIQNGVLQVDTPAISQFCNTDPNIESFTVQENRNANNHQKFYLHTSPEFPMKRLLANDIGSIYQICKVFRSSEKGRHHNSEFTLLEWYRINFDYFELMSEMESLLERINSFFPFYDTTQRYSYRELFLKYINIDPINATVSELINYIKNTTHSLLSVDTMDHD
ncbi:MAG: amino acid--tRNA ligase-related protein, partial [Gammaproteobacteria bacterium]